MVNWQDLAAAALPILIAWVLWRVQAFSVNQVLRGGMYKLLRHQRATYAIVSWFGVLLHEISHAVVLVLGGHGIRGFRIGVDSGHVTPRQVRKGPFGTLSFIAAALAPMVAAPAAVVGLLWFFGRGWPPAIGAGTGLSAVRVNFEETLVAVPVLLVKDLVGMDVTTWVGAGLFALAVFAMPSARPSHVKNKGAADEGDIAVVRRLIRRHPLPVLAFAALLYAAYFLVTPFWPGLYWRAWQVAWIVGLVGIALAILMGTVWYGVAWTGRVQAWAAWIPYAAAIGVQVAGRTLEQPIWVVNVTSVVALVGLAAGLRAIVPRRI